MPATRRSYALTPFVIVGAVVLFAETLRYSFEHIIAPVYASTGLVYRDIQPGRYTLAVGVVAAVALLLPRRVTRPSDVVLWIIFTISAAPSILVSQYLATADPEQATTSGIMIAAAMLMARYLVAARPSDFALHVKVSPAAFWQMLMVVSALIYGYLILTIGFSVRYLNIYDVYSARADFETSLSGDVLLFYLLPAVYYVINPLLIARGLFAHRALPLTVGVLGELYIYSCNGSKTLLFGALAVLALWVLFRFRTWTQPLAHNLFLGVGLGALVITVYDRVTGNIDLTTLFVRRELAVPGALTSAYISIFDGLPKTHFAEILPGVDSPYSVDPTHLVGSLFVHNAQTSANVGLFGHGFVSGGYLGIFIEAAFLAALLWLLDAVSKGLPTPIACAAAIMPALAFAEASAFTVTLTHGFLAAVVVLFAAPRVGWERSQVGGSSAAQMTNAKKAGVSR